MVCTQALQTTSAYYSMAMSSPFVEVSALIGQHAADALQCSLSIQFGNLQTVPFMVRKEAMVAWVASEDFSYPLYKTDERRPRRLHVSGHLF